MARSTQPQVPPNFLTTSNVTNASTARPAAAGVEVGGTSKPVRGAATTAAPAGRPEESAAGNIDVATFQMSFFEYHAIKRILLMVKVRSASVLTIE